MRRGRKEMFKPRNYQEEKPKKKQDVIVKHACIEGPPGTKYTSGEIPTQSPFAVLKDLFK